MVSVQSRWRQFNSAATAYEKTKAMRRVLRWYDREAGTQLEHQLQRLRRPRPRAVVATPDELSALLHHCKPWERLWLLLASLLGLRRSDCQQLAPQHYFAEAREIRLVMKKTGEPIVLPVPDALIPYFEGARCPTPDYPYLRAWMKRSNARLTDKTMKVAWRRLKRRARANPQLRPHDLRRTAATALMDFSKDVRAVQQFLGHRHISSTAHYIAPIAAPELREQLRAMQQRLPTEVKQ